MRQRIVSKKRPIRKVILVVCEGETEETYVKALRHHYQVPIAIKTKVIGNRIDSRLVQQIRKTLGIEHESDCITFFMYDADVENILEKLKGLNGTLLLSNPCIELWYLLHFMEMSRSISSKEVLKLLQSTWKNYSKGTLNTSQIATLTTGSPLACQRAKMLPFPENPSSNIHEFIETLEKVSSH